MISIEQWQQQGDYFTFEEAKIFFCMEGDATRPALLLIHGFPTASWDYHRLWPALADRFRLITLDMIGFGLSDKPLKHAYSLHNQADLFEAFLAEHGIKHYHILAHDYGDTVAQELLARDLECGARKIGSVILLNGGIFPEAIRALLIQKLLLSPLGPVVAQLTNFQRFHKSFETICAKPISEHELKSLWQLINRENGRRVMPRLIQYMKARIKYKNRWTGAIVNANCPLHFINGLLDPISGQKMVDRYRELVGDADVLELTDIGHYPQLEAPEAVLNGAIAFWERYKVL